MGKNGDDVFASCNRRGALSDHVLIGKISEGTTTSVEELESGQTGSAGFAN